MPFKRFVETGRVAYISGGRYGGKLCSIVDVIDQTRVARFFYSLASLGINLSRDLIELLSLKFKNCKFNVTTYSHRRGMLYKFRALVDGPVTGVPRIPIRFNQLRLTKFVVKFPFQASTRIVRKVWDDNKILEKWKESKWAQNLANRKLRRHLTDYDRFKLRHARKVRNTIRTVEFNKLLKDDNRKRDKLRKDNKGKKGYNRRVRKPKSASPAKPAPKAKK